MFLAKLMGPVILLLGVSYFLKPKVYGELMSKLQKSTDFLFVWSIVEMTTGLAIILNHNYWNNLPEILISLMGWALVVEGALIMLSDKVAIKRMGKMANETWLRMGGILGIAFGGYLSYVGYFL